MDETLLDKKISNLRSNFGIKTNDAVYKCIDDEILIRFNIRYDSIYGFELAKKIVQNRKKTWGEGLKVKQETNHVAIKFQCREELLETVFREALKIQEELATAEKKVKAKIFEFAELT